MFGYMLVWIILPILALKWYIKFGMKRNGSYTCLVGKTAIVTGANAGIGYTTALDFAARGARVILGCRNKSKAEDAVKEIIKKTKNPNVLYRIIDMTSLASVRAFAKEINDTEARLDILVNNAGAGGLGNHMTADGIQLMIQVNHISAFLLTHLLLDKLKQSAPSRIVNVSSILAAYAQLDVENINDYPTVYYLIADLMVYSTTKLCNILFTRKLAKKLEGTNVTVNALHPGLVNTQIWRRTPKLFKTYLYMAADLFFKTAEEGADTTIYVATSPDVDHVSGKLFENCRQIRMYRTARDDDLASKLWTKSEELAKLSEEEKI